MVPLCAFCRKHLGLTSGDDEFPNAIPVRNFPIQIVVPNVIGVLKWYFAEWLFVQNATYTPTAAAVFTRNTSVSEGI